MTNKSTPIINHFVAYIKTKPFDNSAEKIDMAAQSIIKNLDLKVVKVFNYKFSPQGITLIFILAESHLAIHTWPESGVIHVDLVTCSQRYEKDFNTFVRHAFSNFNPTSIKLKTIIYDNL